VPVKPITQQLNRLEMPFSVISFVIRASVIQSWPKSETHPVVQFAESVSTWGKKSDCWGVGIIRLKFVF
jgi:hypothetical protein